jgi:hypothetical protein
VTARALGMATRTRALAREPNCPGPHAWNPVPFIALKFDSDLGKVAQGWLVLKAEDPAMRTNWPGDWIRIK